MPDLLTPLQQTVADFCKFLHPQWSVNAGDFTRLLRRIARLEEVGVWDNSIPTFSVGMLASGVSPPNVPVPEPTGILLTIVGLCGLAGYVRRRRR
jgi:hypothetical protein